MTVTTARRLARADARIPGADARVMGRNQTLPASQGVWGYRAKTAPHGWFRRWAGVTAVVALAATALDAVLLQRARGYFTGGFLAVDYVATAPQAAMFLVGSLAADFCALGVVVSLVLWVADRLVRRPSVRLIAVTVASLVPVVVADVIDYELHSFLGDAFDFRLMFDLAGRRPGEIVAVVWAHLAPVAWLAAAAVVAILAGTIVMFRRRRRLSPVRHRPALARCLVTSIVVMSAGVVAVAGLRAGSDVLDNGLRRKATGKLLGGVASTLSDVDLDGYGLLGRPGDPDLFDARVRPYAIDVPGNGIDEDGVAGDLPKGEPYSEHIASGLPWALKPNVVLIALESFRADTVGAVVRGKPVTPVLSALAERGVLVGRAFSHNGYTIQSRGHLFSGGLVDFTGGTTLVDDFKAHGYETAYFSGQDESFGGPQMSQAFARADVAYDARADKGRRYSTFTTAGSLAVPSGVVVERVSAFLRSRQPHRPLFLYVNFHDTHFPYHHRAIRPLLDTPVLAQSDIAPARAGTLRGMYLNTAANVDRAIGAVLEQARASLGGEPAVVVISDHGESLFDGGFLGHGYALNDAQTRIPLIVAGLPVSIVEPFGQSDLRNAILTALASGSEGAMPTVHRALGRVVFQYLGSIERPAQIAFVGLDSRFTYDFRARRARVDGSPWRRAGDLDQAESATYLRLVRTWEQMMLARSRARGTMRPPKD